MVAVATIVGALILIGAVISLFKFAESTISTVISVAVILVSLFLIFGAPNVGSLSGTMGTVKGMFPGTGSAVYTGEAIEITNMENQGNVLIIDVQNIGAEGLTNFEVLVGGTQANIVMASNLLPGTKGRIIVDRKAQAGDAVLVKSSTATDEELFGHDDASTLTGSAASPLCC